MTLDDVAQAARALVAQGGHVSGNAVVQWCHERGIRGNKKAALAHLHQLADAGIQFASVQAYGTVPEVLEVRDAPVMASAPDPVEEAEVLLEACEHDLVDAREELLHLKLRLLSGRPLLIDGLLKGSLHEQDECHSQALWDVESAKQHYDRAWQAREDARRRLEQVTKRYRRQHQEAYVARTRPELVANLQHWQEACTRATNDHVHAEAKKNYQQVRMAYEQAVASAPWNANGMGP